MYMIGLWQMIDGIKATYHNILSSELKCVDWMIQNNIITIRFSLSKEVYQQHPSYWVGTHWAI